MSSADQEVFNITDGRHRYKPCPRCGATIGMGLSTDCRAGAAFVAVWCAKCDFRGPEARTINGPDWWKADKDAFDGWNALARTESASTNDVPGLTNENR